MRLELEGFPDPAHRQLRESALCGHRAIAEILELDPKEVTADAHFANDLGVDSLLGLEPLIALEVQYDIRLTEDDLRTATSLRTAQELITRKLETA
ncbi:phosphopantetheine-binding protein [Streptomyces sp. NPDC097981]|uniref:acyl carrier protein n=1 Tax=Streptomyces sp. NPDC097981 TaxID=3155428 RepID=UPI0033310914